MQEVRVRPPPPLPSRFWLVLGVTFFAAISGLLMRSIV